MINEDIQELAWTGPDGQERTIRARPLLPKHGCPFCKGSWQSFEDADSGVAPFLIHSDPPCPTFVRLDVTEFMRQARRAGSKALS